MVDHGQSVWTVINTESLSHVGGTSDVVAKPPYFPVQRDLSSIILNNNLTVFSQRRRKAPLSFVIDGYLQQDSHESTMLFASFVVPEEPSL